MKDFGELFYNKWEQELRLFLIGKTVKISNAPTSISGDLEKYAGKVVEVDLGSQGYEGEGVAIITFSDDESIYLNRNTIIEFVTEGF